MASCELLQGCLFFNDKMVNMPASAELMKRRYCQENNQDCARYMVFRELGRPRVPVDLFPSDIERAASLISGK